MFHTTTPAIRLPSAHQRTARQLASPTDHNP